MSNVSHNTFQCGTRRSPFVFLWGEREREVQLNQTLVALSPLHDRGEASDDWWPRSQTMSWLDWIKTITATYSLLLVHIYLGLAAKTISGLRQKGWHENDKIMASLVNIWSKAPQQSKGIVFRKSFFILSCLMWDRSTIGHSISERLRKCVALCILLHVGLKQVISSSFSTKRAHALTTPCTAKMNKHKWCTSVSEHWSIEYWKFIQYVV